MTAKARPRVIVVFGLPGTGKTTFARLLARRKSLRHYNSDVIRTLVGKRAQYDPNTKDAIYDELIKRAKKELQNDLGVVIDATFSSQDYRDKVINLANEMNAPINWIRTCADSEVIKKRVGQKREFSEADYDVYEAIMASFDTVDFDHLELYTDRDELNDLIAQAEEYINS